MNLNYQMVLILFQIYSGLYLVHHKKHETLATISPIHVYIYRINNRLVFKIKDQYKLELQKTKRIDKTKNGEKVPSLEVAEVVLVQCNLVNNEYQLKFKVLCSFMPSKSYAYWLNVEPSNLVFLKTYHTVLDEIIITFTYQIGRPLNIEDKVNLTLLINK